MALSITPKLIITAAQKRGWTATIISEPYSFYRLDLPGGSYHYVSNITSVKSHTVNRVISDRKDLFYQLAADLGIAIPATYVYTGDLEAAEEFLKTHKQVVVKPVDQAHGTGITTNITDRASLAEALQLAQTYSPTAAIQEQIIGDDYRVLMIDHKLAAAAIRKPAFVVGDGEHTICELIELENNSGRRSDGYQALLTSIDVPNASRYLGSRMDDVPPKGAEVRVMGTANIGRGGVAIDITDSLDHSIVNIAQKITKHFGIGLCGVDFLVTAEGKPYVIETNASPSLGLHEFPYQGKARNTPDAFLDWLAKA